MEQQRKVLLRSSHLNDHTIGFYPQTQMAYPGRATGQGMAFLASLDLSSTGYIIYARLF